MDLLSQIHFQEQAESPSSHSLRCPLGRLDWLVCGRDLSSLFCLCECDPRISARPGSTGQSSLYDTRLHHCDIDRHGMIDGPRVGSHQLVRQWRRDLDNLLGVQRSLVPPWNLELVLTSLTKAPYEPLASAPLKFLTLKTVFFWPSPQLVELLSFMPSDVMSPILLSQRLGSPRYSVSAGSE